MEDRTSCPECGEPARVESRFVLESTDGPIEHCKVRCPHGHWFLLPVSMLADSRFGRSRARSALGQGPRSTDPELDER